MKPGGGKQKGADFEREVCRRLSLWITNGRQVDCLWRSAMSGGRATVRNREKIDVRQAGDICSVSPEGHALTDRFYIETKSYRDLKLGRFIVLGQGPLKQFWEETKRQSRRYGKRPMLIAKQNGLPILMIVRSAFKGVEPITSYSHSGFIIYYLDDVLAGEFQ